MEKILVISGALWYTIRADCTRYAKMCEVAGGMSGNSHGVCPTNGRFEISTRFVCEWKTAKPRSFIEGGLRRVLCGTGRQGSRSWAGRSVFPHGTERSRSVKKTVFCPDHKDPRHDCVGIFYAPKARNTRKRCKKPKGSANGSGTGTIHINMILHESPRQK